MPLRTIRLELARTAGFPEGSPARGYELKAPLTADGHLDAGAYAAVKKQCTVRRFWVNEADRLGELVHDGRRRYWAISYEPGEDDDEPFWRLEQHRFAVGDYVTIREQDGESLPFRVASVK